MDLAIKLIDDDFDANSAFSCIAGDSWYFGTKVITHLQSLLKDFIFAYITNRKVLANNELIQLKDFIKQLSRSDFKQFTITKTNGQQTVFAKTLRMKKVGRVKVLISYWNDVFVGKPFFLVTNCKE